MARSKIDMKQSLTGEHVGSKIIIPDAKGIFHLKSDAYVASLERQMGSARVELEVDARDVINAKAGKSETSADAWKRLREKGVTRRNVQDLDKIITRQGIRDAVLAQRM